LRQDSLNIFGKLQKLKVYLSQDITEELFVRLQDRTEESDGEDDDSTDVNDTDEESDEVSDDEDETSHVSVSESENDEDTSSESESDKDTSSESKSDIEEEEEEEEDSIARAVAGPAFVHIEEEPQGILKIYMPHDLDDYEMSLLDHLPFALLQHLGLSVKDSGILGAILRVRTLNAVDRILDKNGIIQIDGISRPQNSEEDYLFHHLKVVATPNSP
jgi:hypothetical protein